jgi:hypothetical protein
MSPTAVSLLIPCSVLFGALMAWGVNALVNPASIAGYAVERNIGFAVIQIVTKNGFASRLSIFPKVDHEITVTLEGPDAPSVTLSCDGGVVASRALDSYKWTSVIYHNKTNGEIKSWPHG